MCVLLFAYIFCPTRIKGSPCLSFLSPSPTLLRPTAVIQCSLSLIFLKKIVSMILPVGGWHISLACDYVPYQDLYELNMYVTPLYLLSLSYMQ